ncbi:MAG: hypothetical protein ACREOH_11515 [Candidatus Entotheonellia bacterium]
MPFTVEEFRDLVRILEERPEWRAELRRLVLTDELLALPELVQALGEAQRRTEEQVTALTQRVDTLTQRVDALTQQVTALTQQITALTESQRHLMYQVADLTGIARALSNDVGELKGYGLEYRYRNHFPAYFSGLIRRARLLAGEELVALLEGAVERGELSETEANEVMLADLVLRGRRREDSVEAYLVVEVSWGVGLYDVERAARRAALLGRTGIPAIPVVAGNTVIEEAATLAQMLRVWQVTDGRVTPPGP